MKALIMDSSTIIALSLNCLTSKVFFALKENYNVQPSIPYTVYKETIIAGERHLKYSYEAFRLKKLIEEGYLEVYRNDHVYRNAQRIMNYANMVFYSDAPIKILHDGECEVLALAKFLGEKLVLVDERATRLLIEDPERLRHIMEGKLHRKINMNEEFYKKFINEVGNLKIERSADLLAGLFKKREFSQNNREFLKSLLWAVKFSGCSISPKEIDDYLKLIMGK